jgi:lysyl-tRNA synthetase class 2
MSKESKRPDDLTRLISIKDNLLHRSLLIREIRKFFYKKGFMEVETPIAIKAPAPEDYINAPPAGVHFLRSSPELHMKRMAAAGYGKIFQIGQCFREGEIGKNHNVEFTMLEWYESNQNYIGLMDFLREMLHESIVRIKGSPIIRFRGNEIDFGADWVVFTVEEAFKKFAFTDPETAIKNDEFEITLVEKVEPCLPKDRPVLLKDYPASMAALSKLNKKNPGTAERCELYLGGVEISNAYSELIDYNEQKIRFEKAHKNRQDLGLPAYPEDKDFFEALKYGMSEFAGCAMGIDRLIMVITDAPDIGCVNSFTEF